MLKEILKEHNRSHCYAALAGQSYLPADSEIMIHALNQSGRKLKQQPPWAQDDQFSTAGRIHGKARSIDGGRRHELMAKLGMQET